MAIEVPILWRPSVTTVRSAFRQELEIPLTLSSDWQVALFSMFYTHSFSNAVLKSPNDYHCQVGYYLDPHRSPEVEHSVQLSRHQQLTHARHVLQEMIQQLRVVRHEMTRQSLANLAVPFSSVNIRKCTRPHFCSYGLR